VDGAVRRARWQGLTECHAAATGAGGHKKRPASRVAAGLGIKSRCPGGVPEKY
jgi:hypothetical protein